MPDEARPEWPRRFLGPALGATLALLAAALSPSVLPYNMDEFAHYHALGCARFPRSREWNVYREACAPQELRLPLTTAFLPLRSYAYIGSLPVVPYLPFYALIPGPVSVRFQGAVFLLVAIALYARLLGVRVILAILACVLFPVYPFLFLADTGPSGLTILLALVVLLLIEAALRAPRGRGRVALAAGAGLVAFLGFFVKPVFLLFLPAFALFSMRRSGPDRGWARLRNAGPALTAGLAAFSIPAVILLLSADRAGTPYYRLLRVGGLSLEAASVGEVARLMTHYVVSASAVVPRTLQLPGSPADCVPALAALWLVVWALGTERRNVVGRWLLMTLATLLSILPVGAASEPHHAAFVLFFIVGTVALALDAVARRWRGAPVVVGAVALAFWASLALRWPSATISPDTGADKDRLLEFVRSSGLDSRSIEVHASWGTYYIAHLFGDPGEGVLFLTGLESRKGALERIRNVAVSEKRCILLVSSLPELGRDPAVQEAWGPPTARYSFGTWSAVEYLR